MKRIRAYEETIAERYNENKMRCPTHLSTGQEGIPAVVNCLTTNQDLCVSTHRSHAHYLGKGGCGKKMIAEIYGKVTGCSKGKGGSMHLIDLEKGYKGSTAIVGNTIPIGVGLALSLKLSNSKDISIVFLGDGAVEEGVFFESVNFAALRKLPVLFLCENNFYSVYSHFNVRQPEQRKIHQMVEAMGIPSQFGNGNDVVETYDKTKEAIEHIRNGKGPYFLEFETYRWREHCGPNYDNHIGYRTEQEFLDWKEKDPIAFHQSRLLKDNIIKVSEIDEYDKAIKAEVETAFDFAEKSDYPEKSEAFKHLFKESGPHL